MGAARAPRPEWHMPPAMKEEREAAVARARERGREAEGRAIERLRARGLSEAAIENIGREFGRIQATGIDRTRTLHDMAVIQQMQPIVRQEQDFLGEALGGLAGAIGYGYTYQAMRDDDWGVLERLPGFGRQAVEGVRGTALDFTGRLRGLGEVGAGLGDWVRDFRQRRAGHLVIGGD